MLSVFFALFFHLEFNHNRCYILFRPIYYYFLCIFLPTFSFVVDLRFADRHAYIIIKQIYTIIFDNKYSVRAFRILSYLPTSSDCTTIPWMILTSGRLECWRPPSRDQVLSSEPSSRTSSVEYVTEIGSGLRTTSKQSNYSLTEWVIDWQNYLQADYLIDWLNV